MSSIGGWLSPRAPRNRTRRGTNIVAEVQSPKTRTMIFVLSSFIRLSEPTSRGTVTGQRTSRARLRASCPTSRTSEHSSAGATGCDVRIRMFTTGWAAARRRSACRTADVLALKAHNLDATTFWSAPCGCWRTGSWSITYFILCRSSRDCLKTLRRSRAKGCTALDPQRFSGP